MNTMGLIIFYHSLSCFTEENDNDHRHVDRDSDRDRNSHWNNGGNRDRDQQDEDQTIAFLSLVSAFVQLNLIWRLAHWMNTNVSGRD